MNFVYMDTTMRTRANDGMGFDKELKKLKELKLKTTRAVKTMCKNVKNGAGHPPDHLAVDHR